MVLTMLSEAQIKDGKNSMYAFYSTAVFLITREHGWIMTRCQVSLLAKFSAALHQTSAMEFQPQQV